MNNYTKTIWIPEVTPLSANNLNKIEEGIESTVTEIQRLSEYISAGGNAVAPQIINGSIEPTNKNVIWLDTTDINQDAPVEQMELQQPGAQAMMFNYNIGDINIEGETPRMELDITQNNEIAIEDNTSKDIEISPQSEVIITI